MADLTVDELIKRISESAKMRDFSAVNFYISEMRRHIVENGAAVDEDTAFRLVDALSRSAIYESMPYQDINNPYALIKKIAVAANEKLNPEIRSGLRENWLSLYKLLANPGITIDGPSVTQLMDALRSTREHFDLLGKSADRFISRGQDSVAMRVYYAQALVDTGQPMAAINILESIPHGTPKTEKENDQWHGLLGRSHKQIYVNHVDINRDVPSVHQKYQDHLLKAIANYGAVYDPQVAGEKTYQGINYIALLALAKRHGVQLASGGDEPQDMARKMIGDGFLKATASSNFKSALALGEANIAIGDYEEALKYYTFAVDNPEMKPFNIGSASRQLEEVWGISASGDGAGQVALMLKAQLANRPDTSLLITREEQENILRLPESADSNGKFESPIKDGKYIKFQTLKSIVERAGSVAKIMTPSYSNMGTGFLIKGSDINPEFGDQSLLLTNAHVIWDDNWDPKLTPLQRRQVPMALKPEEAIVIFESEAAGSRANTYSCDKDALWLSPSYLHDVCLIPLKENISHLKPVPVSHPDDYPDAEISEQQGGGTPVAIIGHPGEESLSVSVMGSIENTNGVVVDIGPRQPQPKDPIYMHYRTPTLGGNSGSPVFNSKTWRLVGIHHAGYSEGSGGLSKLNGKPGVNVANEGIYIGSIRHAVKETMTGKGLLKKIAKTPAKKKAIIHRNGKNGIQKK